MAKRFMACTVKPYPASTSELFHTVEIRLTRGYPQFFAIITTEGGDVVLEEYEVVKNRVGRLEVRKLIWRNSAGLHEIWPPEHEQKWRTDLDWKQRYIHVIERLLWARAAGILPEVVDDIVAEDPLKVPEIEEVTCTPEDCVFIDSDGEEGEDP